MLQVASGRCIKQWHLNGACQHGGACNIDHFIDHSRLEAGQLVCTLTCAQSHKKNSSHKQAQNSTNRNIMSRLGSWRYWLPVDCVRCKVHHAADSATVDSAPASAQGVQHNIPSGSGSTHSQGASNTADASNESHRAAALDNGTALATDVDWY